MRGARASLNLLRCAVRNAGAVCDGAEKRGLDVVIPVLRIAAIEDSHWRQRHIFGSRSFASETTDKGYFQDLWSKFSMTTLEYFT
jgi:hypothetical protein